MNAIDSYLSEIQKAYSHGNATEHTYRPFLQTLIESFDKDITAINEHYSKVVSALMQTIELMQNIDETIEENGGFPIE